MLWRVMILNIVVAVAKLAAGIVTGADSMIADGFHSSVDASSNVIGLVGTRLAAQPPDEDHPYGHRRFETLATLAIGGMLLVAAWEILQALLERLLQGGEPDVTPLSFGIMIATIVVNLGVTLYERRRGQALRSSILLADAAHTSTDVFVSLSVIASLAASALGYPIADVVVALVIVVVIVRTGLGIIRQSSGVLADRQTLNPSEVTALVSDVPGLDEIVRVRSRGPADLMWTSTRASTLGDGGSRLRHHKRDEAPDSDTYSDIEKSGALRAATPPGLIMRSKRAVADGMGLSVHGSSPPQQNGIALEMHVEVAPGLTLEEAHRQVTELEAA